MIEHQLQNSIALLARFPCSQCIFAWPVGKGGLLAMKARLKARQYRLAVGPFRAYLGVLKWEATALPAS